MTTALVVILLVLALIDSTSFGTLLIPIWLLLTPGRVKLGRVMRYLATITVFYFLAGIALAAGAIGALEAVSSVMSGIPDTVLLVAQLAIGLGIVALSYLLEARAKRRQGQPGKLTRWREQAMTDAGAGGGLTRLALIAAGLEVATMLPYLIAIGLLASSDISPLAFTGSLALYCLVMVLPAIILMTVRIVAHDRVGPVLQRISDWFTKNSAKAVGWTVGGIGISVALNAIVRLIVA